MDHMWITGIHVEQECPLKLMTEFWILRFLQTHLTYFLGFAGFCGRFAGFCGRFAGEIGRGFARKIPFWRADTESGVSEGNNVFLRHNLS